MADGASRGYDGAQDGDLMQMSARPQGMVRVIVVEDDKATRQRFADAISSDARTTLVQALGAGREAIAQLPAARHLPECDAMVITVFGDERNVLASIEAGAAGYVLKDCSDAELIEHVLDVRAGGAPMSPRGRPDGAQPHAGQA